MHPHILIQLIFYKNAKAIKCRINYFFNKCAGGIEYTYAKKLKT